MWHYLRRLTAFSLPCGDAQTGSLAGASFPSQRHATPASRAARAKPALALAGLGLVLAATSPAAALSYEDAAEQSKSFGTCTGFAVYERDDTDQYNVIEKYEVGIKSGGTSIGSPGGTYVTAVQGEYTIVPTASITPELLASQCGIQDAVITFENGVDGSYWEDNIVYGIEFTGAYDGQQITFSAYMNDLGITVSTQVIGPAGPSGPDVAAIVDAIAQSQRHNAARLLQAQPDLARIVFSGLGTGPDLWLTPGSAGISQNGQFWFKLSSTFDLEGDTEPYLFGVVGGHVMPNNDLALGAMFEFDSSATDQIETSGWLIGPYLVARMPGSSIVAEARLLYGDTVSTGDVLGLDDGELGGDRLLAHLALSGRIEAGIVVFTPRLEGSYVLARSDAYTIDDDTNVPSVETGLAKLKASLDGDIDLIHIGLAGVTLGGGVSGNWSHAQSDGGVETEDFTFGSALRLGFVPSEALRISLGLDLDGIGTDATTARISGGLNGAF